MGLLGPRLRGSDFARWVSLLLVCLPLAQPAITKGALSRKIDRLNEQARRRLVWNKDRSGQLALLETSFVRPGQNQRDNEKDCANSSTESDEVRMEKSACMRAAHLNILLSAQEWCGAATNGDGETTFQQIAQEPMCY